MKPYYEDEWATIYHGDASRVGDLPESSIDCVLTDPPFSSGARTDAGRSMRPKAMRRGAKWDGEWFSHDNMATIGFQYLMRLVCVDLLRAAAPGCRAHFFIDWRQFPNLYGAVESAGWIAKNCLVWDKKHYGMGPNYRNQHEFILYAEKDGGDGFPTHGTGNVLPYPRPQGDNHPTEKPEGLLEQVLVAATRERETTLDPFMGSGSTLVAAKRLDRKSIGIEIEEKYCQIAAERLSQGVLDLAK